MRWSGRPTPRADRRGKPTARPGRRGGRAKLRGYTEIKAPFDGVVTWRAANKGDRVSATEKVALFSVARIDPVRVVVQVPETEAVLVEVGQTVRLSLQTGQSPEETGKVIRTS